MSDLCDYIMNNKCIFEPIAYAVAIATFVSLWYSAFRNSDTSENHKTIDDENKELKK